MPKRKKAYQSRIIWFNLLVAVLSVLSSQIELLRAYLSDGGYLLVLLIVATGNTYLRTITHQGIQR